MDGTYGTSGIGWFFKRYGVEDGLIDELDEMVRVLGEEGGKKPAMAEVCEIIEKIKKLCRKLQKQIEKESKAFA